MGQCVLHEPRSVVRHNESSSLDPGYKAFVAARSRKRFCDKWQGELSRFLPEPEGMAAIAPDAERADALPGVQAAILAGRRLSRRVLVLSDRVEPGGPTSDGIRAMAEAGWAVTVTAGDPGDLGRLGVEVTDDGAASHLRRATVLYDAVVLAGTEGPALLPLLRHRQRQALVASVGSADDVVALAPDRPPTWPGVLHAALRRKVEATRSIA
jgi:hypothetical protein